VLVVFYRERKGGLEYWPGVVPHLDSHAVPYALAGTPAHRIVRYACQGSRGFFLSCLDMREYHSLLIDGNFIAIADVEKVSLSVTLSGRRSLN
jgi:hypothetical protein